MKTTCQYLRVRNKGQKQENTRKPLHVFRPFPLGTRCDCPCYTMIAEVAIFPILAVLMNRIRHLTISWYMEHQVQFLVFSGESIVLIGRIQTAKKTWVRRKWRARLANPISLGNLDEGSQTRSQIWCHSQTAFRTYQCHMPWLPISLF